MSKFSFDIYTNPVQEQSKAPVQGRKATENQVNLYKSLCQQKDVEEEDIINWSYDQMSNRIKELMAINRPSVAQLDLIKAKIETLESMGIEISADLKKLTGGKDGTASKLIEELIEKEKEMAELMPIQDRQLETLVSWFSCPDVPFEAYGINKKVQLADNWRLRTPDEFAEEIKANLNKKDANKMIDEFRGVFFEWKKTRAKLEQIKYIKTLQSRFTTVKSRTFEQVVDFNGDKFDTTTSKHEMVDANQYVSMTDLQLQMLSEEQASRLIDILKSELSAKDLYSGSIKDADGSETFEPLRYHTDDRGNVIQDSNEWAVREMDKCIFKLESIMGYKLDELREMLDENALEPSWNSFKSGMRDVMLQAIDMNYVEYGELVAIFQEDDGVLDILFARDAEVV